MAPEPILLPWFPAAHRVAATMPLLPDDGAETPRGTWRVVGGFGLLVAVGWVLLYFGLFLPRSTP